MRIVFSKDRPAQLDLLLRSLERYAPKEATVVIYRATSSDFVTAYHLARPRHPDVQFEAERKQPPDEFVWQIRAALNQRDSLSETVTFFCDDDLLYRPIDRFPTSALASLPRLLTFSLRLSWPGKPPRSIWHWERFDPHDHGYPGSIDGHTFRTTDVLTMIEGQAIPNPLILETVLAQRVSALAEERPLMACYREQCLVGVNVNSVAEAARTAGQVFPQPAEDLNRRFLAGERISLDALDFSGVDGCLVELPFQWEQAA